MDPPANKTLQEEIDASCIHLKRTHRNKRGVDDAVTDELVTSFHLLSTETRKKKKAKKNSSGSRRPRKPGKSHTKSATSRHRDRPKSLSTSAVKKKRINIRGRDGLSCDPSALVTYHDRAEPPESNGQSMTFNSSSTSTDPWSPGSRSHANSHSSLTFNGSSTSIDLWNPGSRSHAHSHSSSNLHTNYSPKRKSGRGISFACAEELNNEASNFMMEAKSQRNSKIQHKDTSIMSSLTEEASKFLSEAKRGHENVRWRGEHNVSMANTLASVSTGSSTRSSQTSMTETSLSISSLVTDPPTFYRSDVSRYGVYY